MPAAGRVSTASGLLLGQDRQAVGTTAEAKIEFAECDRPAGLIGIGHWTGEMVEDRAVQGPVQGVVATLTLLRRPMAAGMARGAAHLPISESFHRLDRPGVKSAALGSSDPRRPHSSACLADDSVKRNFRQEVLTEQA